jgi:PiT family inorganic phosphate transporter
LGVAALVTRFARWGLARASIRVDAVIRRAQWFTSGWLAFSHGANDAQKTVGVVAALLLATGHIQALTAPLWVKFACAMALTMGTAFGGWSIVRTIGARIIRLRPLDGLVSQASSAGVIIAASIIGAPVSTTQVVSSSVVGIGVGRRRTRHVHWKIVGSIAIAWITTMPAAAALAALSLPLWRWIT